jgi:hypothetical protein
LSSECVMSTFCAKRYGQSTFSAPRNPHVRDQSGWFLCLHYVFDDKTSELQLNRLVPYPDRSEIPNALTQDSRATPNLPWRELGNQSCSTAHEKLSSDPDWDASSLSSGGCNYYTEILERFRSATQAILHCSGILTCWSVAHWCEAPIGDCLCKKQLDLFG